MTIIIPLYHMYIYIYTYIDILIYIYIYVTLILSEPSVRGQQGVPFSEPILREHETTPLQRSTTISIQTPERFRV